MSKLNELRAGLLNEIERVAWMDESDEEIVNSIRGLLYQWSQIQDHVTQDMFGDDDAHKTESLWGSDEPVKSF